MNPCKVCGKADYQKPQIFRGTDWCSTLHRKVVLDKISRDEADRLAAEAVTR